ncbi:MAG: glycosyl transferase family 1 [Thermoprotei archaeon]|nr:MAG: glycosyl transferase family 1 [Thermoprotei archaeon]
MKRLRIGILSRWNATCGVSLHAELIAWEWVRRGHKVAVFAPNPLSASRDWHHKLINDDEEPWVVRCYDEADDPQSGYIDIEKILSFDMDVLLVELYGRLPARSLSILVEILHNRGVPVVAVIHCTTSAEFEPFKNIKFDSYAVFDQRFVDEILARYLERSELEKVSIIPYPCFKGLNVKPERPDFAKDKTLFFTFGRQPPEEYKDYLEALDRLSKSYDLVYWIVRSDGLLDVDKPWVVQWRRRLQLNEAYSYIKASDVHLVPKSRGEGKVVVSSTVYQTLATLVPIVVPDGRYVETIPSDEDGVGPVVKYRNLEDLIRKLRLLIEDGEFRKKVMGNAMKFVEMYGSDKIAEKFLQLFNMLLQR